MDGIDRKLVHLLQEDASQSAAELGEAVGLSATSCWRRIQRLRDRGVLTRRVELVDRKAVNLGLMALVEIQATNHSAAWLEQFVGVGGWIRLHNVLPRGGKWPATHLVIQSMPKVW